MSVNSGELNRSDRPITPGGRRVFEQKGDIFMRSLGGVDTNETAAFNYNRDHVCVCVFS